LAFDLLVHATRHDPPSTTTTWAVPHRAIDAAGDQRPTRGGRV